MAELLGAVLLRLLAVLCLLGLVVVHLLCMLLKAALPSQPPPPRASPLEDPVPGELTFWTDGDDFL